MLPNHYSNIKSSITTACCTASQINYLIVLSKFRIMLLGWFSGIRSPFWSILGPQIGDNSGLWWFSQNKFPLVLHQSWFTCQFELLLKTCWRSTSEAKFPDHFGPKIDNNSGLQGFSQTFSICFASFLTFVFIGASFRYISIMFPKCPISEPIVKVASGFVRPSGLFWAQILSRCFRDNRQLYDYFSTGEVGKINANGMVNT